MKAFAILLLAIAIISGAGGQLPTNERDQQLTKANELTAQVVQLYSTGKYKDALPLAQTVVDIRERLLSRDDGALGSAYSDLAEVNFQLKKDADAERLFEKALAVYEAQRPLNNIVVATMLD